MFPDGCTTTTQSVYKKHPLHQNAPVHKFQQRREMLRVNGGGSHDLPVGERWSTCGSTIGGWARDVPLHEHQRDLRAARAHVDGEDGRHDLAMRLSASCSRIPATSSMDALAAHQGRHDRLPESEGVPIDGPKRGSIVGDVMDFKPPAHGFPGKPQASRGMHAGAQPKWCFERMPSLLHDHMRRDRGRLGRPVAGVPPPYLRSQPPPSAGQLAREAAGGQPRTPYRSFSTSAIPPVPRDPGELREATLSTPLIGPIAPRDRPRNGDLHVHIGTTWDDASKIAGDKYQGSFGRFMGF